MLLSPSAYAGFDWTPPPLGGQQPAQTEGNAPLPPVVSAPLTPEPIDTPAQAAPATPAAPMKSLPQRNTGNANAQMLGTTVDGFGKDIPLGMALRDIVPTNYSFSFSSPDIAGIRVSWRGGKAWTQVLNEALSSVGLSSGINGNTVVISRGEQASRSPVVPAQTPRSAQPSSAALNAQPAMPDTLPVPQGNTPNGRNSSALADFAPPAVSNIPDPKTLKPRVPVVDMSAVAEWKAKPGSTLKDILQKWCQQANVDLNWSTSYDFPVTSDFQYEGTFDEAVDSLLSSFSRDQTPPKGRLYPNLPDGPSILMVEN